MTTNLPLSGCENATTTIAGRGRTMALTKNMTARDLLLLIGGKDHDYCTVLYKKFDGGVVRFICSCGSNHIACKDKDNLYALRNVMEEGVNPIVTYKSSKTK